MRFTGTLFSDKPILLQQEERNIQKRRRLTVSHLGEWKVRWTEFHSDGPVPRTLRKTPKNIAKDGKRVKVWKFWVEYEVVMGTLRVWLPTSFDLDSVLKFWADSPFNEKGFRHTSDDNLTGWCFGTWLLWLSIQLGMESSPQLTNSLHHFSEG